MSALRRWSTPCLWLALLAYLMMSGIDVVHTHAHFVRPFIPHHTSMSVVLPGQDNCPICAWHAMTTASCRMDVAQPVIPNVPQTTGGGIRRVIPIPPSTVRSRAPPRKQVCHYNPTCIFSTC